MKKTAHRSRIHYLENLHLKDSRKIHLRSVFNFRSIPIFLDIYSGHYIPYFYPRYKESLH